MKKLFLLLFIPVVCLGQAELNSFKYFNILESSYTGGDRDVYGIEDELRNLFLASTYKLYNSLDPKMRKEVANDPCIVSQVDFKHSFDSFAGIIVTITFNNCLGKEVYRTSGKQFIASNTKYYYKKAVIKAFKPIKKHNYFFDLTKRFKISYPEVEMFDETKESLTYYYDSNKIEPLEGIYREMNGQYTIGIKKIKDDFKGIVIESDYNHWNTGEVKIIFKQTAKPKVYSFKYYLNDKTDINSFVFIEDKSLIEIPISDETNVTFIKTYPINIGSKNININSKQNEWAGNGSGIIISKSGYIITNHHVIEDAEDIEVEFILNDEVQKFNAEIVQIDKTNDLAIIKIVDVNFDGLSEPPYNFKFRGSDVGTKVYAFGYPMALSIMGKEIKVTDGMISSKTGFDGNITTYQITAPIQGGNSGGPLFDEQANLIGINSSGIRKDIADNVAYSIKTSYVSNLLDVLPKSIELPSSTILKSLPLTEQIKEISKYVVLIKVK